METDQKLGLLAGVAAVLVVAVVYFSKPLPVQAGDPPKATAVETGPTRPPASVSVPVGVTRPAAADD